MTGAGSSKLAFVGAGNMGLPMVRRLADAGHDVTVFARRPEVRDTCVQAGAAATVDLHQAVRDAEMVLVCVFSDAQVHEVTLGPAGFLGDLRRGTTVVVHTTGSPATARTLAEAGADRGIRVVEAPVSGSAQDIDAGHVTVLLGGEPDDLELVRPIVAAYGDPVLTMGPLGSAQAVKLLNNALFTAQVQLAAEVERIAASFGVEGGRAAAAIQQSSGASYAMSLVERMGSVETLADAAGHWLAKDVAVVTEVAAELDLDLGVLGVVNQHGPLTFDD